LLAKDGGLADWNALRDRPLATLLVVSGALKLAYVFLLTEYPKYLYSDFGSYWNRALERLAGGEFNYGQWAIWPPLPHILLSWYLKLVRLLGFSTWQLEATMVANVVASTASVALVYGIALETLRRRPWALAVAALYAFTFPLIYFNAFVMSEHGAVLLMLAGLWLVLRGRQSGALLAATGALLGLATAMRPPFGLFGLPIALYLVLEGRFAPRAVLRAGAFSLAFFAIVGGAVALTYHLSRGQVLGLAASGGQNFYFSQCRVRAVTSTYQGQSYTFTNPSFVRRPEYGWVHFNAPMHDQALFRQLGWQCLKEEPRPWEAISQRAGDLFFGPLLPSSPSAKGFTLLLPAFRWFFLSCALILPLGFFVRRTHGVDTGALSLLGGMLAVAVLALGVFSVEHRYLYPLVPLMYVVVACVLLAVVEDPRRMAVRTAAWAAVLGLTGLAALGVQAARWYGVAPAIGIEIRKFPAPYVPQTAEPIVAKQSTRRLYYPGADRLWHPGSDDTFALLRSCMEVRSAGLYELQVVAGTGFSLLVDGHVLMANRFAQLEEAYKWRIELAPGKHAYAVRMDRPVGVTATWRRVTGPSSDFYPALHMRYIGEPGEDAVFLPPERC
jgi:4-amino-4-deoxy-L-arabinose transferase-like glycosyltransferase